MGYALSSHGPELCLGIRSLQVSMLCHLVLEYVHSLTLR